MSQSLQIYLDNLLGGDLFLKSNASQLQALWKNSAFMQLINSIVSQVETTSLDFEAEKNLAKKMLFEQNAYYNYPAYKQIVDATKEQGYAQNSAAISTYCVMRMLQERIDLTPILGSVALSFSSDEISSEYASSDDADAERWNEICFLVNRYRTPHATERDFQIEAENILEKLGWSRFRGEISTQVSIPVGAAQSVRPDIILRDDEANVMVIELKKPAAEISSRNADQLFSYMRLLRLEYGLLIGDTIQLYYDDPGTAESPVKVIDVPFIANSFDGIELCKTISRDQFSLPYLKAFVESLMRRETLDVQSEQLFQLLSSSEGGGLIRHALFQFLCERQSPEVVNMTLDRIDFSSFVAKEGSDLVLKSSSTTKAPDEFAAMKVGRLANEVLRYLLEQGAASEEEVASMQDTSYSKRMFDLNFPLLVPASAPHNRTRYYASPLYIRGEEYKLCSQWYETSVNNDRPYLIHWIREHQKKPVPCAD